MKTAETQKVVESIVTAMLDTIERLLKQGCDQKAVWAATRDCLISQFGYSTLAAANTTRLMIAATAQRLGCESPYTREALVTIHQIAMAN